MIYNEVPEKLQIYRVTTDSTCVADCLIRCHGKYANTGLSDEDELLLGWIYDFLGVGEDDLPDHVERLYSDDYLGDHITTALGDVLSVVVTGFVL